MKNRIEKVKQQIKQQVEQQDVLPRLIETMHTLRLSMTQAIHDYWALQ
jgi:hypothetical protein